MNTYIHIAVDQVLASMNINGKEQEDAHRACLEVYEAEQDVCPFDYTDWMKYSDKVKAIEKEYGFFRTQEVLKKANVTVALVVAA
jgi:hypothetical protein